MEDIKKTHIPLLEVKTSMCEMENSLDGINVRLNIIGEKINKLEDIAIETIQNETQREKRLKKNSSSLSCEKMSSSQIYL